MGTHGQNQPSALLAECWQCLLHSPSYLSKTCTNELKVSFCFCNHIALCILLLFCSVLKTFIKISREHSYYMVPLFTSKIRISIRAGEIQIQGGWGKPPWAPSVDFCYFCKGTEVFPPSPWPRGQVWEVRCGTLHGLLLFPMLTCRSNPSDQIGIWFVEIMRLGEFLHIFSMFLLWESRGQFPEKKKTGKENLRTDLKVGLGNLV